MTVVAGKRVQRSLAAIPAALKTHRKELVDPRTAEHDGRIVKLMGDGALVEFASMVDVVKRAVAIQRGMSERNAHISEDRGRLAEGLRAAGLPG